MRPLTSADRPLLRDATLANMNWNEERFTLDDVDAAHEISHYFTSFPSGRDFGLAHQDANVVKAVAWVVFLPAEDPGYGFVDADTPELSITTFAAYRGRGIGSQLLSDLISQARRHKPQRRGRQRRTTPLRARRLWSRRTQRRFGHDVSRVDLMLSRERACAQQRSDAAVDDDECDLVFVGPLRE